MLMIVWGGKCSYILADLAATVSKRTNTRAAETTLPEEHTWPQSNTIRSQWSYLEVSRAKESSLETRLAKLS